MLRIISGTYRSRLINTPPTSLTQPTKDRVREAIFSSLGDAVQDAVVLDLFAGSGALGIEAASRGARYVYFNDRLPLAAETIQSNLDQLKLEHARVMQLPYGICLKKLKEEGVKVNLVFLDPPYRKGMAEQSFHALMDSSVLLDHAIIVVEDDQPNTWLDVLPSWTVRHYEYGQTKVSIAWKKN